MRITLANHVVKDELWYSHLPKHWCYSEAYWSLITFLCKIFKLLHIFNCFVEPIRSVITYQLHFRISPILGAILIPKFYTSWLPVFTISLSWMKNLWNNVHTADCSPCTSCSWSKGSRRLVYSTAGMRTLAEPLQRYLTKPISACLLSLQLVCYLTPEVSLN